MVDFLFHYFDESVGPFRNLSDLEPEAAKHVLQEIRVQNKGFTSRRSADYLFIRRSLEAKARELFIEKGGRPARPLPHYMTFGECPWLLEWYENGKELRIPITHFDPLPTMRVQDGRKYRGQVYTLHEIYQVIREFGRNYDGKGGSERYIEVQIWDDTPLTAWLSL
ncbi:hypothetical protein ACFFK0_17055 [Paenibacillus chartarius]|uniref:Uncharacterized protein n=1 Tax=Paenibacillus chartarius TaxID=747481 RepID=A0ABV6DNC7_9BACL